MDFVVGDPFDRCLRERVGVRADATPARFGAERPGRGAIGVDVRHAGAHVADDTDPVSIGVDHSVPLDRFVDRHVVGHDGWRERVRRLPVRPLLTLLSRDELAGLRVAWLLLALPGAFPPSLLLKLALLTLPRRLLRPALPFLLATTGTLTEVTGLLLPPLLAKLSSLASPDPLLVLALARLLAVLLLGLPPTLPRLLAAATGMGRLTGLLVGLLTLLPELTVLTALTLLTAMTPLVAAIAVFWSALPSELALSSLLTGLAPLTFPARLLPRRRLAAVLAVLTGLFPGPVTGPFAAPGPPLASFLLSALSPLVRPARSLSSSPLLSSPRSVLP